jgi:hypothetical protein
MCYNTLQVIEDWIIIVGDLQSFVFTPPSCVYVGGLILLTSPLPTLDRIVQSVIELNKSSWKMEQEKVWKVLDGIYWKNGG